MTDNECRCRIREASSARLSVLDSGAQTSVDVTYSVDGNTVVLRPTLDVGSAVLATRRRVLLEIDSATPETRTCWRVVVTGLCEPAVSKYGRPTDTDTDARPANVIELRIQFLEGRHGAPEALPPGSAVPQPRRATA